MVPLRACTSYAERIAVRLASWVQLLFQRSTDQADARYGNRCSGQVSALYKLRSGISVFS
ncbi:hypothetical protein D3C85_1592560 [compost metagenome]